MKKIILTRGLCALVDTADFLFLSQWKWTAKKGNSGYYAVRNGGERGEIYMHKELLGIGRGVQGDHKDHNSLNNQRYNLRRAPGSGNNHNAKKRRDNTSGFKGVSWHKSSCRWASRIFWKGKSKHLGHFLNVVAAAKAYDAAARQLFGEFAVLNFP